MASPDTRQHAWNVVMGATLALLIVGITLYDMVTALPTFRYILGAITLAAVLVILLRYQYLLRRHEDALFYTLLHAPVAIPGSRACRHTSSTIADVRCSKGGTHHFCHDVRDGWQECGPSDCDLQEAPRDLASGTQS